MAVHFRYSVYVLEASTTNRLTYFIPPLVSFMQFYFRMRCLLPSPFHGQCVDSRQMGDAVASMRKADRRRTNILNNSTCSYDSLASTELV
jgi:hypothetical protein